MLMLLLPLPLRLTFRSLSLSLSFLSRIFWLCLCPTLRHTAMESKLLSAILSPHLTHSLRTREPAIPSLVQQWRGLYYIWVHTEDVYYVKNAITIWTGSLAFSRSLFGFVVHATKFPVRTFCCRACSREQFALEFLPTMGRPVVVSNTVLWTFVSTFNWCHFRRIHSPNAEWNSATQTQCANANFVGFSRTSGRAPHARDNSADAWRYYYLCIIFDSN